jgi:DNA primase large subunit
LAVRRPVPLGERELSAEYPFLPGAERLVAELAPSFKELLSDATYARARELGRARVSAAVDDPTGATALEDLARASPEERFLSFLYARLLLSTASTPAPLRRWAVAEAKRGWNRFGSVPVAELSEIARRLGYPIEPEGSDVTFHLPDYLHLATAIREGEFRLVRQALRGGKVRVSRERAARLLQEGVRVRLTEPLPVADDTREAVSVAEREFLEEVARRVPRPTARTGPGVAKLLPEKFPPCIRKMRRMLENGENLSHSGRFALAAFLHRAGADFDTIVDAYRGAPDFDESVTRYQVEHITHRDEGFGYEPPECGTLRSHGLCFREGDPAASATVDQGRDPLCFEPWLKHPLQYYRTLGGVVVERERTTTSAAPASGR